MTHPTATSTNGFPRRPSDRLRARSSEGKRALELVTGGLVFTVLCILLNAWVDVSIGQLHLIAALALVGLLAVVAAGAFALVAIARRGERSMWVLSTLVVSLVALLLIVAQIAFDVP